MNKQDRKGFSTNFQKFFKLGTGAEIGVDRGVHAKMIFEGYEGKVLMVDPWEKQKNWNSDINERDYSYMYNLFLENTKAFEDRRIIKRGRSVEVAKEIEDESLDFVYIDAQHSYSGALEDIEAWFPKVRKGGLVSGHDYYNAKRGDPIGNTGKKVVEDFGVKDAVDYFVEKNGYKIEVTLKDHTWFFIK